MATVTVEASSPPAYHWSTDRVAVPPSSAVTVPAKAVSKVESVWADGTAHLPTVGAVGGQRERACPAPEPASWGSTDALSWAEASCWTAVESSCAQAPRDASATSATTEGAGSPGVHGFLLGAGPVRSPCHT